MKSPFTKGVIPAHVWNTIYNLYEEFAEKKADYSHSAFKREVEECFSGYVAEQLGAEFTDKEHERITETALHWGH
jgi:hypothetical protein